MLWPNTESVTTFLMYCALSWEVTFWIFFFSLLDDDSLLDDLPEPFGDRRGKSFFWIFSLIYLKALQTLFQFLQAWKNRYFNFKKCKYNFSMVIIHIHSSWSLKCLDYLPKKWFIYLNIWKKYSVFERNKQYGDKISFLTCSIFWHLSF